MALAFTHKRQPDGVLIELRGEINGAEAAVFDDVLAAAAGQGASVRLDLAGVTAMNSRGAALWKLFLDRLAPADVELHRAPSYFIDFLNLVPLIGEGATVVSFQVPFRCACGNEQVDTLQSDAVTPAAMAPRPCPKCKGTLKPDVDPDEYLGFLGA